ncbi:MAG: SGNH/GDSL hydrolase family protein [Rhodanobacter sp.]
MTTARSYLALGDSYSIGEGVAAADRWPVQLAEQLRKLGIATAEPAILATTGWTTDELAHAMDGASLPPPYDLVTLQIGVNNQYRSRALDEYRQQFGDLLTRAIHLAGDRAAHVMVLSIPDWGVTRFAREHGRDGALIANELDQFNAVAQEEVQRVGAVWVDVTAISRQKPEMVVADGLHPSAAQYALWVGQILPNARGILS